MSLSYLLKKSFWSRQKNWRESRSRETEVGEKIAVTNPWYVVDLQT